MPSATKSSPDDRTLSRPVTLQKNKELLRTSSPEMKQVRNVGLVGLRRRLKNRTTTLRLATMHPMSGFTSILSCTSLPTEAMLPTRLLKHFKTRSTYCPPGFTSVLRTTTDFLWTRSTQFRPSESRIKAGHRFSFFLFLETLDGSRKESSRGVFGLV